MIWLVLAFIVLPSTGVLLLLPYPSFRTARENCTRADGTLSRARKKRERKHATDFAAQMLLVPIIVVAIVGSALIVVHEFIAPIPLLLEVMGAYEVNATGWENAIEREGLGDVGARYEDWSGRQGFTQSTARFWQEVLWDHWFTVLLLVALLGGVFYAAVSKFFVGASVAYQRGVKARASEYWLRDLGGPTQFQRPLSEFLN